MESPAHIVTEILRSFEKCIPTDRPTDRPTDMVRYRAAEAANKQHVYNIQMKSLSFVVCEIFVKKSIFDL